jgi:hypothetical protein
MNPTLAPAKDRIQQAHAILRGDDEDTKAVREMLELIVEYMVEIEHRKNGPGANVIRFSAYAGSSRRPPR